jgi:hypothetical protein
MRYRTIGFMMIAMAIGILFFGSGLNAQQMASPSSPVVPRLVNFSGNATDVHGKAISGVAGATFAIYKEQYEGSPLWMETQNVHADTDGNYTVQLGATKSEGLPVELFTTPEPRWLGVRINGGEEQPRVLLVSVPYALKAADAETLGGKPLSAFQLAPVASNNNASSHEAQPALTEQTNEIACSSGTACKAKFIPQFSSNGGSAKVSDSIISQSGTTIGISGHAAVTGSLTAGSVTGSTGVTGTSSTGADAILGQNTAGGFGVHGTASVAGGSPAIWGENFATSGGIADGVHGVAHSGGSSGMAGVNVGAGGTGVGGYSTGVNGFGVYGQGGSPSGVNMSGATIGVWGDTGSLNGYGVFGSAAGNQGLDGVHGISFNGVGSGVAGINFAGGDGIFGGQVPGGFAGFFSGNVSVTGSLSKGGGSFKIDHPLDPANKYLYHSFVESPDMMNIYNDNVTTDAQGNAIVVLPEWFEVLNRDFRYQLTVIGQFAQAIVSSEIANGQFSIKTDKPNVKVSWQVTGIRHDVWANAHRIPVEEMKPEQERGFYLHPELFGAPPEKSIAVRRHPFYTERPASQSTLRHDNSANTN